MKGTILVVDDERNQREILGSILTDEGYRTLLAGSGQEALDTLEREHLDLVLTDLVMPGMTGEDLIDAILVKSPGIPIILNSAYGTVQTAVDAIKRGAFYYLEKPVDRARLLIIIERAIENLRLKESHRALSERLFPGAASIVGDHPVIREIKRILPRIARSDAIVLLTGESGTGKEVVARNIHSLSGRSHAPFLAVNCASLPDSLFESELFGHERGAFTGAIRREIGLFEAARGGTLFLDEIAEVRPETQAKLLRGLQDGEIRRVGGKMNITVDVRIVAASNRDLEKEVREGRFRADLFYRLNILALNLPPLRERISDIPALAQHLLAKHGEKGVPPVRKIAKEAMRLMMRYLWPGNIRELSSVIERAVVLAEGGEIGPAELPAELREDTEGKSQIRPARPPGQARHGSGEEKGRAEIPGIADLPPGGLDFEKLEESLLRRSVERSGGVHTRGAELLKMSYKTYIYRLKKFGIIPL
ncbi:MAG: sigma-54-dependent transcriptional regulator [Candidatus Deferrimicrobiaceae bacterium]